MQNIVFDGRAKIFINENLSAANESVANNCKKPRWAKIVDSCHSRYGIICIKNAANNKPEKLHHMKKCRNLFPDFVFSNDEENIPHAEHDAVNVSSDYGAVYVTY